MPLITRRIVCVLIATAVAGGGLSACGGDDEQASTPEAPPAATSATTGGADAGASNGRGVGVNDADGAYVRQMIPHDAQMVVMASRAKSTSENAGVREIAAAVRENLTEELRTLQQFATSKNYDLSKPDVRKEQDAAALHTTADKLGTPLVQDPPDGEFDQAFVALMIEHHKGSLVMSRAVRKHGVDDELKKLAAKNVKQLNDELDQLKAIQQQL